MLEHYPTAPGDRRSYEQLYADLLANTIARKKIEARIAASLDLKSACKLLLAVEAAARLTPPLALPASREEYQQHKHATPALGGSGRDGSPSRPPIPSEGNGG